MWSLSLLLLFVFSGVLMADYQAELRKCSDILDAEKLDHLVDIQDESILEVACPNMLGFMNCLDETAENNIGLSIAQLEVMAPEPQIAKAAKVFNNVKALLTDVCTDGSDLNNAFKRNSECLMDSASSDFDICKRNVRSAKKSYMKTYLDIDWDEDDLNGPDCMRDIYMSACIATEVHDNCGRDAFDFYQTIVKRSTFFKNKVCSERELEEMQTLFLDSLEHEEEHHKDLFKLAFDLRKRRK